MITKNLQQKRNIYTVDIYITVCGTLNLLSLSLMLYPLAIHKFIAIFIYSYISISPPN